MCATLGFLDYSARTPFSDAKINLRLFALLREQTGVDRESLETSAQSVSALRTSWFSVAEPGRVCRIRSVQGSHQPDPGGEDHAIQDGDEVAFFPPVTGG